MGTQPWNVPGCKSPLGRRRSGVVKVAQVCKCSRSGSKHLWASCGGRSIAASKPNGKHLRRNEYGSSENEVAIEENDVARSCTQSAVAGLSSPS